MKKINNDGPSDEWMVFNPHSSFEEMRRLGDDDFCEFQMGLLRTFVGPVVSMALDDRELWETIRNIINSGCMDLYFRFSGDGVEIQPEFHVSVDEIQPVLMQ